MFNVLKMSDNFMSDSEAEEDADFSASEDEWLPGKEKGAKTSGVAKSDSEDESGSDASNKSEQLVKSNSKRGSKSSGAR